jgi:putative ABC transport system permease protein
VIHDTYPDRKRDRSLYVNKMEMRGKEAMNSSTFSYYFLDHYVRSLKTPVKIAISTMFSSTNTYVNDRKVVINYKYTNADFWDVLEFEFLEGKALSKQQIDNAERVTVISEDMKNEYFGADIPSVIGKYIEADNVKYRVCGVVKNLPITNYTMYSDIYLPFTVTKQDYKNNKSYLGDYITILLAANEADVPKMKKEFAQMIQKVPMPSKEFDHIYADANTFLEAYVNTGNHDSSGKLIAFSTIGIFALFVMLLPTLNLVNINITRIMERSSEIGVRKAFGASSQTLVYQFIVENLILTFLGGLIGIVISLIAMYFINNARFIANLDLSLNLTVLCYAMLICLIFGMLSGVYPAWRMSKLNVVTALKA